MSEKNLAVFDDDAVYIDVLSRELNGYGYNIVVTAESVEMAKSLIPQLASSSVVAVLIDKFLIGGLGDLIVKEMNDQNVNIPTVGIGSSYDVVGTNGNIRKNAPTIDLVNLLNSLV